MSDKYVCDLLVIGGGSAGSTAAMAAVGFGAKVILAEESSLGGTCTNVGCVPSKVWLHAADLIRSVGRAKAYGLIDKTAAPEFDLIQRTKTGIADSFRSNGTKVMEQAGIEIIHGRAAFVEPRLISIDGRMVEADRVLIATGSSPFVPPIDGLEQVPYLTSSDTLALPELPKSILIVGGSYIGLEIATFFNTIGVKTTVIEALDRIAPNEDKEVSEMLAKMMADQGIDIHTSTKVERVSKIDGGVSIEASQADQMISVSGEKMLIATGRKPALNELNLVAAGVTFGRKGIEVDRFLETAAAGIYAAGDVLPSLQLEHVGVYEGGLAVNNMFSDQREGADYRVIPRVMFTYPEVASVGETEEQAARARPVVAETIPYAALAMAKIDGEPQGLIKLVADAAGGQLVGAHIVGHDAGNLIHLASQAMSFNLPVDKVAASIAAYPTLAQGFFYAAEALTEKIETSKRAA